MVSPQAPRASPTTAYRLVCAPRSTAVVVMAPVTPAMPLSRSPQSSAVVALPVMPTPLPDGQPLSTSSQPENLGFGYTERVPQKVRRNMPPDDAYPNTNNNDESSPSPQLLVGRRPRVTLAWRLAGLLLGALCSSRPKRKHAQPLIHTSGSLHDIDRTGSRFLVPSNPSR